MNQVLETEILENEEIAENIYRIVFDAPAAAAAAVPGQFINVYLNEPDKLLPRPISICDADAGPGTLTLVYRAGDAATGTRRLAGYGAGRRVRLGMPAGNGFDLRGIPGAEPRERSGAGSEPEPAMGAGAGDSAGVRAPAPGTGRLPGSGAGRTSCPPVLLVGGGIGTPPMLLLTKALIAKGVPVTCVTGFASRDILTQELRKAGAALFPVLQQETGQTVLDFITDMQTRIKSHSPSPARSEASHIIRGRDWEKSASPSPDRSEALSAFMHPAAIFTCGPLPMMQALAGHFIKQGQPPETIQISMEERMGCGYGACVGCVCDIKQPEGTITKQKICKNGPVFRASQLII